MADPTNSPPPTAPKPATEAAIGELLGQVKKDPKLTLITLGGLAVIGFFANNGSIPFWTVAQGQALEKRIETVEKNHEKLEQRYQADAEFIRKALQTIMLRLPRQRRAPADED